MTTVACISQYRLRKLRRQIPIKISEVTVDNVELLDYRLHSALGEVLADPKVSRAAKISELKSTLRIYQRLTDHFREHLL